MTLARLTVRQEFLQVAGTGNKFVTRSMVMQYRHDAAQQQAQLSRVGFTATRKLGGAVQRNRIKRRLREVFRTAYNQRPVHGYDLVIIGRHGAQTLPYATLCEDMRYALGKLSKTASS